MPTGVYPRKLLKKRFMEKVDKSGPGRCWIWTGSKFQEGYGQIKYKAEWNDIAVIFADQFYPSSKTCSECGLVREKLTLSERLFICPECGVVLDRDLNAARNLAALVEPQNLRELPGELVPLGTTVNQEVGGAEC